MSELIFLILVFILLVKQISGKEKTSKIKAGKLTVVQTWRLLDVYHVSKYPGKKTGRKLATELNLSEIVVKVKVI